MLNYSIRIGIRTALQLGSRCKSTNAFGFFSETVTIPRKTDRPKNTISQEEILLLERLSLVGFNTNEISQIVEEAISEASILEEVNTEGVEPMVSVLEDVSLHLREDVIVPDTKLNDLLSHSSKTIENYYITPGVGQLTGFVEPKPKAVNENSVEN